MYDCPEGSDGRLQVLNPGSAWSTLLRCPDRKRSPGARIQRRRRSQEEFFLELNQVAAFG